MIDPAATTSEPTSSLNLITRRAKPPPDEKVASAWTASAANPRTGKASATRNKAAPSRRPAPRRRDRARPRRVASAPALARNQNPAAAIRAIPVYVFQFIRIADGPRE